MELPPSVEKMLDDIAVEEGFKNHTVKMESGSGRGDNYQGLMVSVKLNGGRIIDGAVTNETLNLICKVAPESKTRREVFKTVEAYKREIFMYTKLLPVFVQFQREKDLSAEESFLSFPKVYACIADEANETYALIMEDLRPSGFTMWPRHDPISLNHEKLLLTQLGRFHGVSIALKDQRPVVFAAFRRLDDYHMKWIGSGLLENLVDELFERAINVLKNNEHKTIIRQLKLKYWETWTAFFAIDALDRFGVVGHGDCWINNFLFYCEEDV